MKRINALFIMLFCSVAAFAQTTWVIDKSHSTIGFSVTHMAVSEVEGSFKEFDGSVVSKKPTISMVPK